MLNRLVVAAVLVALILAICAPMGMAENKTANTTKPDPFIGYLWLKGPDVPIRQNDAQSGRMVVREVARFGRCIVPVTVTGAKVSFGEKGEMYVRPSEVTCDPRLSLQWEAARLNSFATCLWDRVEEMACSKPFRELTEAILKDMIAEGVIPGVSSWDDLHPHDGFMSKKEIDAILLDYSMISWRENPNP